MSMFLFLLFLFDIICKVFLLFDMVMSSGIKGIRGPIVKTKKLFLFCLFVPFGCLGVFMILAF